ncbi:MAG: phasin family protein [Actinomycetota bacterium]
MSKPKKAYLASLGIASLSYEKAKNIAKGLVKKGDLLKEKQEKFIKELTEKAKENSEEIKEKANKTIDDLVKKGEKLDKKAEEKIINNIKKTSEDIKKRRIIRKEAKEKEFESKIEEILSRFDVPTQKDLEEIKQKLNEINKVIEKEK